MSRWKGLPPELDPRLRRLVVSLRRLKDHSGLSLRQLAAKTGYSTSSWERYLGGRSLPPREAVEAIASVAGEDPTRLLALRDVAAAALAGERTDAVDADPSPRTTAAPGEPGDGSSGTGRPEPPRGRSLRVAVAAGVVAVVLAASSAVVLVARFAADEGRAASPSTPSTPSTAPAGAASASQAPFYTCRIERVDGRWYAGLSRTRDAILANGHAGAEVAEAQCLLRRTGHPPGDIDGIYGPLTERAVKRLQQEAGLVVDGIVGPHTWGALRK